jgi:hypothetical protein
MLASPGGDWPICLELEQAPRWMPRVNHMHLRGKDARFEATYPDGRKETLLLVPHYNFNWQITYRMEEPKFLPKGTRMAIISHFDNSPNNPLNPDPAKVVRWGEASEMEMMDGWIEYLDAPRGGTAQPQLHADLR